MRRFSPAFFGFLAAIIAIPSALAQQIIVNCTGLVGCGQGPSNVLFNVLPRIAAFLITIAAGTSVIFVVWSGVQLVLSWTDEGRVAKAKTGILYALGGLGLCLTAATIVAAVATEELTQGSSNDLVINVMQSAVRIILLLFNSLFVVAVIYGGFTMVLGQGKSDQYQKGFQTVGYAIGGAVIVNAGRAIVQAFLNLEL